MKYKFDPHKNSLLLQQRQISFDDIITAIFNGDLVTVRDHHNSEKYPHQKIIYVRIAQEIYAVPCIFEEGGDIFLKTIYPSRKARKMFS